MNKRPIIPTHLDGLYKSRTVVRTFAHAGVSYEVRLQDIDGSPFATVHLAGSKCERALHPYPDEVPRNISAEAVQAAYVTVAEWLVKTGRWPDAETLNKCGYENSADQAA